MSCGKPHEIDCAEVLNRIYVFIDNEIDGASPVSYSQIQQHLHECAPCLSKYDLERVVKMLVHRSCGAEHAPEALRARVLSRIQQVRVDLAEG